MDTKMKVRKKLITFSIMLFCASLPALSAEAANTLFQTPTSYASQGISPDNLIYENDPFSIQAEQWGGGTEATILMGSGMSLGSVVQELNQNVQPQGGKPALTIYMSDATISGSVMDQLAGAGWKCLDLYFYDYSVRGVPQSGLGDLSPVVSLVENEQIDSLLQRRGYENRYVTICLSEWPFTGAMINLYAKNLGVGTGLPLNCYKYDEELGSFIFLSNKVYYDKVIMTVNGIDGDGIYLVTEGSLTEEQMQPDADLTEEENGDQDVSPAESMREDGVGDAGGGENENGTLTGQDDLVNEETFVGETPEAAEGEAAGDESMETGGNLVVSADEKIAWNFEEANTFPDFSPEAVITVADGQTVSVSFVYDGPLPGTTEVSISLPAGVFSEGEQLYLYYCNPESRENEFVDSGVYRDGRVSFTMTHCSDYIITSHILESEEKSGTGLIIGVAVAVVILLLAGVLCRKARKIPAG